MASAETSLRLGSRLSSVGLRAPDRVASLVRIVCNPVREGNPQLAEKLERVVRDALQGEGLGDVEVRFRVCREDGDSLVFICKVENPPRKDSEAGYPSWRWWSPLLVSADGFETALQEALDLRRQRLAEERLSPRNAS